MSDEITRSLDEATEGHRLLEHPFYRAWRAGTLTSQDLAFYSEQYWRQVEAFPGYLESLAERMQPGAPRDIVGDNLRDEVEDDHAGLWLDFAAALGVPEDRVRASRPEKETTDCVGSFRDACKSSDLSFALGMLYGYESQTPAVAETKVAGLREHYGIEGAAAKYFELHGELDVEHSRELGEAIEDVATSPEDLEQARRGARAGAEAIYGLLDGVARARGITAAV